MQRIDEKQLQGFELKAEQGDVNYQLYLGNHYYLGTDVSKADHQKAMKWYLKAAMQGDGMSLWLVGASYDGVWGDVQIDREKAIEYYEKAVASGEKKAETYLKKALLNKVNQAQFMVNAQLFLDAFTHVRTLANGQIIEEKQILNRKGFCHSLSIMYLRAWMISEQQHYIERWKKFCSMSPDEVKKTADLGVKHQALYKIFHQLLAAGEVFTIEKLRTAYENLKPPFNLTHKYLSRLSQLLNNLQACIGKLNLYVDQVDEQAKIKKIISKLKKERDILLNEIVCKNAVKSEKLSDAKVESNIFKKELDFSLEINAYISSLLFLQEGFNEAPVLIKENGVQLYAGYHHIIEFIKMVAPDQGVSIRKALSFSFTFRKDNDELLAVLKRSVYEGDVVYFRSHTNRTDIGGHAILLMRQGKTWLLLDPNGKIEGELVEDKELRSEISRQLFSNVGLATLPEHLPVSFQVFEKINAPFLKRPTTESLIQTIRSFRPKDSLNINAGLSDKLSALRCALVINDSNLIKSLVKYGAIEDDVKKTSLLDKQGTINKNQWIELEKRAELGSADNQSDLAHVYNMGEYGVKSNPVKALLWYQKAAIQRNGYANYLVGYGCETGWGGLQIDKSKALEYYKKAVDYGQTSMQEDIDVLNRSITRAANQAQFIKNAELFLNAFTYTKTHRWSRNTEEKETLGTNLFGFSNSLTIMFIRAWMVGEQKHYIERWNKFCSLSSDEVTKSADLVKKYQVFYQLLADNEMVVLEKLDSSWSASKYNSSYIKELIQVIKDIQALQILLDPLAVNAADQLKIKLAIVDLKKKYHSLINKVICEKEMLDAHKSPNENELNILEKELDFSLEMRLYLSSILFLKGKSETLFKIEDKERGVERIALSNHILDKMKVIAPDQGVLIREALAFAFTFKQDGIIKNKSGSEELLHILKRSVHDGDLVCLRNYLSYYADNQYDHSLYLMRENNKWLLVDPTGKIDPKFLDEKDLTRHIRSQLYADLDYQPPARYLPVIFYVFEKVNSPYAERPTIENLVQEICDLRRKDGIDIDAGLSNAASALYLAVISDNAKLVRVLLQHGASADRNLVLHSHSNAVRNMLIDYNRKEILRRDKKLLLGLALLLGFVGKADNSFLYLPVTVILAVLVLMFEKKNMEIEGNLPDAMMKKISHDKKIESIKFFSPAPKQTPLSIVELDEKGAPLMNGGSSVVVNGKANLLKFAH
jgi:TPR repeat protein